MFELLKALFLGSSFDFICAFCEAYSKPKTRHSDPDRVNPGLAQLALKQAGGDRSKAYSECTRIMFQATGRLYPGFNNEDLQAFYDQKSNTTSSEKMWYPTRWR